MKERNWRHAYKKKMLPLHPQPIHGEILSSWMIRLAFANELKLHTFYSGLLGYKAPIWNRDVDRHPPQTLFTSLERQTGQTEGQLRSLALSSYDGMLFESHLPTTNSSLILPLGIRHRLHRRSGMQFCPLCLREDQVPFYRKAWRLAFNVICNKHNCVMEEICPGCLAPISFHRHGIGRERVIIENAFLYCSQCGFDLRLTTPLPFVWKDGESAAVMKKICDAGNKAQLNCGQYLFSIDVPFMQGLYVLLNLVNGRQAYRILPELLRNIGDENKKYVNGARSQFEYLSVHDRLQLMRRVAWLLVDWPERFVVLCREGCLTRSRILADATSLPFWLEDVVNEFLDNRVYTLSDREILDAGTYLQRRGVKITYLAFRELLGIGKDSARSARSRWLEIHRANSCNVSQ